MPPWLTGAASERPAAAGGAGESHLSTRGRQGAAGGQEPNAGAGGAAELTARAAAALTAGGTHHARGAEVT